MERLGGYDLVDVVGQGSMGMVFRARQAGVPENIGWLAVKRVPAAGEPGLVTQLSQEANVLASLAHPHVVRVLEVVPDGAGVAIVMEYVPGGSLADALGRDGRLAAPEVGLLAAQVADALAGAHGLGLVHCDVKPSNILLGEGGQAKLSDFGLARWMASASLWGSAVLGTAEYLDPVVAEGGVPGPPSDIYALGVVCYEALTGRLPYVGATPLAVLRAADRGRAVPIVEVAPQVPPSLASVVEAAMARRADRRPAGAAQMAAAMRGALGCSPVAGRPQVWHPPGDGQPAMAIAGDGPTIGAGDVISNGPGQLSEGTASKEMPLPDGSIGDRRGPRPLRPRTPVVRERLGPRVAPAGSGVRARRITLVLPAALVVTAALGALGVLERHGPGSGHRLPQAGRPQVAARCQAAAEPVPSPGATVLTADVNGCVTTAVWSHNVLSVSLEGRGPPARFALGQPGDQAVLGDWACTGRATPALYRPSTGEVFYFTGWAGPRRPLASRGVERTGVLGGRPQVRRGPPGCDRVAVDPAGSAGGRPGAQAEAHETPSATP